jgi:heterodisulfide reductase subunit A-like polyferredoxin
MCVSDPERLIITVIVVCFALPDISLLDSIEFSFMQFGINVPRIKVFVMEIANGTVHCSTMCCAALSTERDFGLEVLTPITMKSISRTECGESVKPRLSINHCVSEL